ncbi:RlpA-like double-psi beta-barrel-protein domain-containing protein-containing protein [Lactifluus volemus]|nr:RlpA-like double-psi beta-barrel-protein domain-containing protein-containing protein [Lactifluus volemus]
MMQLFTAFVAVATLAAPVFATYLPFQRGELSARCDFLCGSQIGQGTWYQTGLGACGITNKDSDHIVAVSHSVFDVYPGYTGANPNDNPICGKQIQANYQGKSVIVTVTDRCVSCDMTDLDFSPSVFRELADPSVGRIGVTWSWV